jgi:hypothetical protein
LREETPTPGSDDRALAAMMADAVSLEQSYGGMLSTLERDGTRVVRHGVDDPAPVLVPAERRDCLSATLRAALGPTGDPDEFIVWSDDGYGGRDAEVPMPVSRVPDGGSAPMLRGALAASDTRAGDRRGVRNIRRPFAEQIHTALPGGEALLIAEPTTFAETPALDGDLVYLMPHGDFADSSRFWGEDTPSGAARGPQQQPVKTTRDVAELTASPASGASSASRAESAGATSADDLDRTLGPGEARGMQPAVELGGDGDENVAAAGLAKASLDAGVLAPHVVDHGLAARAVAERA